MAGPIFRLMSKMAETGIQIAFRAAKQAFTAEQQRRAGSTAKGLGGTTTTQAIKDKMQGKIKVEEARAILNVKSESTAEEVQQRYDHLFAQNEPQKGGSFYLQSKIFRAKQCLDSSIEHTAAGASAGEASGHGKGSSPT